MAETPEFSFVELPPLKDEHNVTIHQILWTRLHEIATRHYEGSVSKAIEGLALHEWMVELHRLSKGLGLNTHWISAPLVLRPGELVPVLRRLLQGDVDYVGSYFDQRIQEAATEELRQLREENAALKERVRQLEEGR